MIPNSSGVNAFKHPSPLSKFTILNPGPGGDFLTLVYPWPSVKYASIGSIVGGVTSFGRTFTQISFADPTFSNSQFCPSDLHLYSEQGKVSSLHSSQTSPPVGACQGIQLNSTISTFDFLYIRIKTATPIPSPIIPAFGPSHDKLD